MSMNRKQHDYIVKVAKHITSQTKIVPLEGDVYDLSEYGAYGLIYPFMCSEDIYYVGTLERGDTIIQNDLEWYAKEYYGLTNSEIYDLIDVYQAMVSQKLKKLIN